MCDRTHVHLRRTSVCSEVLQKKSFSRKFFRLPFKCAWPSATVCVILWSYCFHCFERSRIAARWNTNPLKCPEYSRSTVRPSDRAILSAPRPHFLPNRPHQISARPKCVRRPCLTPHQSVHHRSWTSIHRSNAHYRIFTCSPARRRSARPRSVRRRSASRCSRQHTYRSRPVRALPMAAPIIRCYRSVRIPAVRRTVWSRSAWIRTASRTNLGSSITRRRPKPVWFVEMRRKHFFCDFVTVSATVLVWLLLNLSHCGVTSISYKR